MYLVNNLEQYEISPRIHKSESVEIIPVYSWTFQQTPQIESTKHYITNANYCLQEKVDLGELMLTLCYLPTAGRLTVTVIKARNLKAMDITGSSGQYFRIFNI